MYVVHLSIRSVPYTGTKLVRCSVRKAYLRSLLRRSCEAARCWCPNKEANVEPSKAPVGNFLASVRTIWFIASLARSCLQRLTWYLDRDSPLTRFRLKKLRSTSSVGCLFKNCLRKTKSLISKSATTDLGARENGFLMAKEVTMGRSSNRSGWLQTFRNDINA